jgi:hypothetical protein
MISTKTQAQPDWRPQDLEMMTPEQRESYEQRLLRERPKYIPMKHEDVARLSPEDRQQKHLDVMLLEVDRTKFCKTFWRSKCILKTEILCKFLPANPRARF